MAWHAATISASARAASLSNGNTRPANKLSKARSQARARPQRRLPSGSNAMPVWISASVTAVTNSSCGGRSSVQARTPALGSARINSETILVSATTIATVSFEARRFAHQFSWRATPAQCR